ncbi:hypothetical protein [Acinetobacter sp. NIPH 2100]|uniref:hypothetical protein n=1 Tax=Acinetobacter sp. NIPH 2100 TaxID=1217708 RepID=UPI0002D0CA16|nr:hypothetical protein [Acinetobacter sp. NIPH 2100]ENX43014.1 hypothetical protein F887_01184 [Acinetobacter sp. NIPH 2100]
MKFDFRFNIVALILFSLLLITAFLAIAKGPLLLTWNVHLIEDIQALVLLACVPFTWFYMKPQTLTEQKKWFWMWAIAWWFMFFGRSISWGRDFFPEVPHIYYRVISVFVIAPVVLMLFSSHLRAEIEYKFHQVKFPFWYLLIAILSLFFADSVEHHRFIYTWLFSDAMNQDIVEELYETPFIFALFFMAFYFMKKDRVKVAGLEQLSNQAKSSSYS